MDVKEKRYRTSDLNLSAYLMCAKVELLGVEREAGSKRSFMIFSRGPGHENLVNEYFNRKGKVVALEFADHLKNLKTRIYAE